VSLRNTIVALNTVPSQNSVGGPDLDGPFISKGHNLIGAGSTSTGFPPGTNANGDLVGTKTSPIDPRLGPLANNGGPTQTNALLPGSTAIDAGDNCVTQAAHCGDADLPQLTTDQRGAGFPRTLNGTVDIGAFESPGFTVGDSPLLSINDVSITEGDLGTKTLNFTVTLFSGGNLTVKVDYATANGTATAGSDYVAIPTSTLTFNPGDSTKTVSVTINGDQTFEPDETLLVNLSNPVNASIGKPQGTGTILNDDPQVAVFRLSSAGYSVNENANFITITVTRSGNISIPVTVDYLTEPTGTPAAACSYYSGTASPACDYTTAIGTLKFAAGDTSKTFDVLLSQDLYPEGAETFDVVLTGLTGNATFGAPKRATVTIFNVANQGPTNPIDDVQYFVRQHYHDFLNREPDPAGLAFWMNQINSCGNNAQCIEARRIDVSASFFLSIEFQQSGYLVERFYKTAYGDVPKISTFGSIHLVMVPVIRFNEVVKDTQRLQQGVMVLQPGWEQALENNKQFYALEFVQTQRFIDAYPAPLTPAEFVDRLDFFAGNVLSPGERTAAINLFGGAANSSNNIARAQALRQIADDADLVSREFNRAFVLAEYFGYLRRNPNDDPEPMLDYTGYDFWLTKLNQFNGNYDNAEMVKAFLSSGEYRQRFGP